MLCSRKDLFCLILQASTLWHFNQTLCWIKIVPSGIGQIYQKLVALVAYSNENPTYNVTILPDTLSDVGERFIWFSYNLSDNSWVSDVIFAPCKKNVIWWIDNNAQLHSSIFCPSVLAERRMWRSRPVYIAKWLWEGSTVQLSDIVVVVPLSLWVTGLVLNTLP